MKSATKRLALCFIALSTLGGCAVYGPGYPTTYYDTDPYSQPQAVYSAPPVYAAPVYVGPPVFLNFGYRSGGGYRKHHGGNRGFRGHGRGHR
ncbi:MAG: hypothetical protein ACOH2K_15050 [Burkholderiaceae bacterium]